MSVFKRSCDTGELISIVYKVPIICKVLSQLLGSKWFRVDYNMVAGLKEAYQLSWEKQAFEEIIVLK